jgi:hypothetical protein
MEKGKVITWNVDEDLIIPLFEQYPQVEKIIRFKKTLFELSFHQIYKLTSAKLNWLLKNESEETLFWVNTFLEDLKFKIDCKIQELYWKGQTMKIKYSQDRDSAYYYYAKIEY